MDKELRDIERQILSGDTSHLPQYLNWQARAGKVATLFVVVSGTFDYNDEYFYQTEGGGGEPINAFLSEARAEEEARRLDVVWLHQNASELGAWHYEGLEGLFDMDEGAIQEFLSSRGATLDGDGIDISNCSDAQCLEIVDALDVSVHFIRSIPLVDGLCSPDEVMLFCQSAQNEGGDKIVGQEDAG